MRKGIEFIGKVDEAWVTNLVFGSDKSRGEFGKSLSVVVPTRNLLARVLLVET